MVQIVPAIYFANESLSDSGCVRPQLCTLYGNLFTNEIKLSTGLYQCDLTKVTDLF